MPTIKLTIFGNASGRVIKELFISTDSINSQISLMSYLHLNQIPIASSCSGEGVCKKCNLLTESNQEIISCQIKMKNFINCDTSDKIISINYL